MALFEVPGWSVPSAPVQEASQPRKRKRSAATENPDGKMQTAQINVEKLLQKFHKDVTGVAGEESTRKKRKKKNGDKAVSEAAQAGAKGTGRPEKKMDSQGERQLTRSAKRSRNKQLRAEGQPKTNPNTQGAQGAAAGRTEGDAKRKKRARHAQSAAEAQGSDVPDAQKSSPSVLETAEKNNDQSNEGLTALQAGMKSSLDGARFRWINEQLYKSDSNKALEMMRQNPRVFSEYHTGFRHQVSSWPSNPVTHYIKQLSSYPAKTVITDLGAGDAALARALVPQGMTVLSFDLVADGKYVVEADTCSKLPLPGSESGGGGGGDEGDDHESPLSEEGGVKAEGTGGVVDVVVCALSLMGTNWPGTIREAWRILRPGGELMIAEVASRFTDIDEFAGFVSSFGFKLKRKDDTNTHFTLFEFKKVARLPKSDKEWSKMLSRGGMLKPCEYKRR